MSKEKDKKDFIPDYHFCCNKGTPKEEREKMCIGDIWINAIICLRCNTYVRSKNRHHMAYCECGKCAVDGGSWYGKVSFETSGDCLYICEMFGDVEDEESNS